MLDCDGLLDLAIFCLYPGIMLIATCMQFCKRFETKLFLAVVDQPTWRFWEEKDETCKNACRCNLKTERDSPLVVVSVVLVGAVDNPC